MIVSPLSLDRYAFRRIEIIAAEESEGASEAAVNRINATVASSRHQSEENRFMLTLEINLLADPTSLLKPFYTGTLIIEGYFSISEQLPKDRWEELVIANGTSLLFGAIREMVVNVTSRGPWPPVMLRTVNFVDTARRLIAKQTTAEISGARVSGSREIATAPLL